VHLHACLAKDVTDEQLDPLDSMQVTLTALAAAQTREPLYFPQDSGFGNGGGAYVLS
jgi:hypothetical protein